MGASVSSVAAAVRWRRTFWIAGVAIVLAVLVASLTYLAQPQRATRLILGQLGATLGLEISAATGTLRLSGTPSLMAQDVTVRERGAARPLLQADRVRLSVPWSTIRARGKLLNIQRVELDRPVLDVAAMQHWLQQRPPGKTRLPVLTDGLEIRDGRLRGSGWAIDALNLQLPRFAPASRVSAQARGRYASGGPQVPFALALALSSAAPDAALGIAGDVAIVRADWRMPAQVVLSGRLRSNGGMQLQRMRLSAAARYEAGTTRAPFALGVGGTLQLGATTRLAPAAIALRASGPVPTLDAAGAIAVSKRLDLRFAGRLVQWPLEWPPLPPPLDRSSSPFPFQLDYSGEPDLRGIAALRIQRDQARFNGRFRVADLAAWIGATDNGSPLPPLDGSLTTPRIDIGGAQLQGVEVTLDDTAIPGAAPHATP